MAFFGCSRKRKEHVSQKDETEHGNISGKVIVFDKSNNQAVMSLNEINGDMSDKGFFINSEDSPETISRYQPLLSDLLKGYVSIPNKTIEVVFNPQIMKGLENGSYELMTTKAGETLADAVDKAGKFVGKGRIVETGKIKQLCGGGYQLLSIAVAQSHLADINNRLDCIQESCRTIEQILKNEALSEIKGDISYLQRLFNDLNNCKNFEISAERSSQIEVIINRLFQYDERVLLDFDSIIKNIEQQKNIELWGSGDTYKELNRKIKEIDGVIKRKSTINQLVMLLKYIISVIDPYQKKYTSLNVPLFDSKWIELSETLVPMINNKVKEVIKAIFNDEDVLLVRREQLISSAEIYKNRLDNLKRDGDYAQLALEHKLLKLTNLNGNLHYYLSFDANGQIKQAGTAYSSNFIG